MANELERCIKSSIPFFSLLPKPIPVVWLIHYILQFSLQAAIDCTEDSHLPVGADKQVPCFEMPPFLIAFMQNRSMHCNSLQQTRGGIHCSQILKQLPFKIFIFLLNVTVFFFQGMTAHRSCTGFLLWKRQFLFSWRPTHRVLQSTMSLPVKLQLHKSAVIPSKRYIILE